MWFIGTLEVILKETHHLLKKGRYGLGTNGHVNNMNSHLIFTQNVLNFQSSYDNCMIALILK